jgi:hypothetical protein
MTPDSWGGGAIMNRCWKITIALEGLPNMIPSTIHAKMLERASSAPKRKSALSARNSTPGSLGGRLIRGAVSSANQVTVVGTSRYREVAGRRVTGKKKEGLGLGTIILRSTHVADRLAAVASWR